MISPTFYIAKMPGIFFRGINPEVKGNAITELFFFMVTRHKIYRDSMVFTLCRFHFSPVSPPRSTPAETRREAV